MKRSQLKKVIAPIVEELVQEALEEILEDPAYLNDLIKESILKSGLLTEVTRQIAAGMSGERVVVREAMRVKPNPDNSYRDYIEELNEETGRTRNTVGADIIKNLKERTKLDVFDDRVLEESKNVPLNVAANQAVEISSEAQALNPILAVDPQNNGGVPLDIISQLSGIDARNFGKMAGIKGKK